VNGKVSRWVASSNVVATSRPLCIGMLGRPSRPLHGTLTDAAVSKVPELPVEYGGLARTPESVDLGIPESADGVGSRD
jgi:hypothetical protein